MDRSSEVLDGGCERTSSKKPLARLCLCVEENFLDQCFLLLTCDKDVCMKAMGMHAVSAPAYFHTLGSYSNYEAPKIHILQRPFSVLIAWIKHPQFYVNQRIINTDGAEVELHVSLCSSSSSSSSKFSMSPLAPPSQEQRHTRKMKPKTKNPPRCPRSFPCPEHRSRNRRRCCEGRERYRSSRCSRCQGHSVKTARRNRGIKRARSGSGEPGTLHRRKQQLGRV